EGELFGDERAGDGTEARATHGIRELHGVEAELDKPPPEIGRDRPRLLAGAGRRAQEGSGEGPDRLLDHPLFVLEVKGDHATDRTGVDWRVKRVDQAWVPCEDNFSNMVCPKCGAEGPDGPECGQCGVVIDKWVRRGPGSSTASAMAPLRAAPRRRADVRRRPAGGMITFFITLALLSGGGAVGFQYYRLYQRGEEIGKVISLAIQPVFYRGVMLTPQRLFEQIRTLAAKSEVELPTDRVYLKINSEGDKVHIVAK